MNLVINFSAPKKETLNLDSCHRVQHRFISTVCEQITSAQYGDAVLSNVQISHQQ